MLVEIDSASRGESPLGVIVARIEEAYESADYALTADLLQREFLAAWFGMEPARFVEVFRVIAAQDIDQTPFIQVLTPFFLAPPDGAESRTERDSQLDSDRAARGAAIAANDTSDAKPTGDPYTDYLTQGVALIAQVFLLRTEGRPVEALEKSRILDEHFGELHTVFDRYRGWGLFTAVQHGLNLMLAGDFVGALQSFKKARMHQTPPELLFLTRDACAKAALVEALFGDSDRARALLDEADQIERTHSWAEAHIDAAYAIAASRVRADTPEEALEILDAIPLRDIGEVWPLYLHATQINLMLLGRIEEASRRNTRFEQLPLPRTEGQGYTGSAIPISASLVAALQGDIQTARERLSVADQALVLTDIVRCVLDAGTGKQREALQNAMALRERTRNLQDLDTWRLGLIAECHLSMRAEQDCLDVLDYLLHRDGGLNYRQLVLLSPQVRGVGEQHFADWPESQTETDEVFLGVLRPSQEPLSARELDVLKGLADGLNREQIAKTQFISINTLKTQLRSLYRKLDVNSQSAAVLEGHRRGLI